MELEKRYRAAWHFDWISEKARSTQMINFFSSCIFC